MFDLLDRDNGRFSNDRDMSAILDTARRFEKTEARDSIYAILGLVNQDKTLEGDEAALLEVDYTKSIPDVLRDATRYALSERNDLNVLSRIHHRVDMSADSQTFPTWTLRADLLHQSQDAFGLPYLYRAFEGLEAPSLLGDVSFDKSLLLLQGVVVNQVGQTTAVYYRDILDEDEGYHQWLVLVKDMVMCHRNIATQENIDLVIASTLVVGQAKSGKEAQPADLQVLAEYIKSLAIREDGIKSDGVSIRPHFNKEKMAATVETARVYFSEDRRFFVTTDGYMGLGPRCMQPEDIVVVLRGGWMPFILRKKVDSYWLIGAAYVHGIMHGEAVELDRSRGGSEMVFHVR
ncbi:hypothetical protein AG0111_0g11322 [Alternaria gaisen]|uniref:Uncharacterized protein n=1 Tax=Alternaria gaisen TaxID=167740 RepID=A0ACB6F7T8_9PLEO|nr:hypothetical protein AG0111_0g11322 [Alternaria gaisen]